MNAAPSEITAVACDEQRDRLDMAKLFNEVKSRRSSDDTFQYYCKKGEMIIWHSFLQMSRIVIDSVPNSSEAYYGPASLELRKNLGPLKDVGDEMNKILLVEQTTRDGAGAMDIDKTDKAEAAESVGNDH